MEKSNFNYILFSNLLHNKFFHSFLMRNLGGRDSLMKKLKAQQINSIVNLAFMQQWRALFKTKISSTNT